MPHVGHQGDAMTRDCILPRSALFENTGGERVAKVMDARPTLTTRRDPGSIQYFVEDSLYNRIVDFALSYRQKQVVIVGNNCPPQVEISINHNQYARVQWNQPALAELGFPDVKDAVWLNIWQAQFERFRYPQPGDSDQAEKNSVDFTPDRKDLVLLHLVGGVDKPCEFVGGEDVRYELCTMRDKDA